MQDFVHQPYCLCGFPSESIVQTPPLYLQETHQIGQAPKVCVAGWQLKVVQWRLGLSRVGVDLVPRF